MKEPRKIAFILSVLILLYGCISSTSFSTKPEFSQEIEQENANFILYVSNQSFDKSKIDISVTIDGVMIANDEFRVKNQHYWKIYSIRLSHGLHTLVATADKGKYKIEKQFENSLGRFKFLV
jgi:hypothetical protein